MLCYNTFFLVYPQHMYTANSSPTSGVRVFIRFSDIADDGWEVDAGAPVEVPVDAEEVAGVVDAGEVRVVGPDPVMAPVVDRFVSVSVPVAVVVTFPAVVCVPVGKLKLDSGSVGVTLLVCC